MEKKELFKYLIREFHESALPELNTRDLTVPDTRKIITLVGSRRSGKTFYFYQLIKEFLKKAPKERVIYINFEDDRILPLDFKELDGIFEAYYELYPENKDKEIYVFFDELQNIKSWELYVRRIYDKEKVRLFVTGSSSKLLSREIATSLRGRTLTLYVFPLSFSEFLKFNDIKIDKNTFYSKERFKIKKLFEKYLILGGFPEVALEKNNLEHQILSSYYEIMIYKDIVERFSVRNTNLLKSLGKFLMTNISSQFSVNAYYNYLKENIAVSKETVFEYLSYLEEANLVFFVSLFDYSFKRQQANPKKVYCIDNGLRNVVAFIFSKDEGKLAENLVFIELKRRGKEIYYWKNKGEVDFVIKNKNQKLTAINVSYTDRIGEREIKTLLEFKEKFKSKVEELILLTKDTEKLENIRYIPLWKWLLEDQKK
ncbi:ATP-binding protein [Candidatus Woesearchaeota archaeon]|nr:ATP-binding protein [Candidatus Woesearchaeota archaeon]